MPNARHALVALASLTTLTAIAMTAVAAWDRGGTLIDRALLVALSVAIIAAVHLLPALSRRPSAWALWCGCLLCAVYGHLTFFTHAGLRAGEVRAQHSARVVGAAQQIEAAREALAGISARPVSVIASELASTRGWQKRSALQAELSEARRAAVLRDGMVKLSSTAIDAEVMGAGDPVTARIAALLGVTDGSIALLAGLAFSVLLELVGAFLWYEVMQAHDVDGQAAQDPLDDLRQAVAERRCKPTVAGIRSFLGCGQAKASEMRRALLAAQTHHGYHYHTCCHCPDRVGSLCSGEQIQAGKGTYRAGEIIRDGAKSDGRGMQLYRRSEPPARFPYGLDAKR